MNKKANLQFLSFLWPLGELILLCVFLFLSFDFYYSWGQPYSFAIPPEQHFNILLALPLYALVHLLVFYDWKEKRLHSLFLRSGQTIDLYLRLRSLGAFLSFSLIFNLISAYRVQTLNLGVTLVFLCILSIISFYEVIYGYLSSLWKFKPSSALHLRPIQKKDSKYLKFGILIILLLLFPFGLNLSRQLKVDLYAAYKRALLPDASKENTIQIYIKKKAFRKIKTSVQRSLDISLIHPQEKRFYNAYLEYAGQKMPIKIRLKGDWTDHVNEKRHWSFYIKFTSKHTFRGMREFAIQHPKTRSWLYECYIVRLLRRHNILAPRCGLLAVRVNKQAWGAYLYQEAFSPQLLEAMHRRAGPILKLKEGGIWEDRTKRNAYLRKDNTLRSDWFFTKRENYLMPTVGFKEKQYQEDQADLELYAAALRKFNLYRDGNLDANEVLDLAAYAKYYAFMCLLGGNTYY